MYEYCTTFFDIRHLVIAVNPAHIEMYESLLFFRRLEQNMVDKYDFVNGAPAIGATLDLQEAPEMLRHHYSSKPSGRNLYAYFVQLKLPNIQLPRRRFFTTNDPVLTPDILDYFFNRQTRIFENLDEREKALLHAIYDLPEYRAVLPKFSAPTNTTPLRHHDRFSVKCPAQVSFRTLDGLQNIPVEIFEVSRSGFQARALTSMPLNILCETTIQLGCDEVAHVRGQAVREKLDGSRGFYGFRLCESDEHWKDFVSALYRNMTFNDLESAPVH